MIPGDQVDVMTLTGRGWHGTVAGYTAQTLRLSGPLRTWNDDEAVDLDADEYREVLLPWERVDFVEVWRK